jgi:pimeloyl-ACP methyl ester carboxylesterase
LETLGTEPCVVFGNSTGALIALAAALKAPGRFTGAVLHEPALLGVLANPDVAMATVQPVIAAGVEAGGLAGGAEAFVQFAEAMPPRCCRRTFSTVSGPTPGSCWKRSLELLRPGGPNRRPCRE